LPQGKFCRGGACVEDTSEASKADFSLSVPPNTKSIMSIKKDEFSKYAYVITSTEEEIIEQDFDFITGSYDDLYYNVRDDEDNLISDGII